MAYKTIILKNYSNVFEEMVAATAILPGMLVEQTASAATVGVHSTAGGPTAPIMFAYEDALQGKDIDDAYAIGDQVRVWIPKSGDQVYACLEDEQTIVEGDLLESNGEGYLQKHTSATGDSSTYVYYDSIVGRAMEDLDLSTLPEGSDSSAGGAYYHPRIRVRIA